MSEDKKIVKRIKLIDFGFGVFKDKIKDLPLKILLLDRQMNWPMPQH
jgi:tRNA A-37 threonylcarbamoyl transferase component Bud32